jgi:LCP family protein required for cell wall assembly
MRNSAADQAGQVPSRRWRPRRIALTAIGAAFALVLVVAVAGYATVNHYAAHIKRIPGVFTALDTSDRPVLPAASRKGMTILLTGAGTYRPAGQGAPQMTNLIALVHFDADYRSGAVVSIPGNTEVNIPGHGQSLLQNTLQLGGPALLIQTIQKLTNVPIDHYSVVNFSDLARVLKPLGGVNVELPATTSSDGIVFHAGVVHLNASTALAYVRQPSLNQEERVQRQQALLRGIVAEFVTKNLISDPLRDLSLLDTFTSALSVDSTFSNADLLTLAGELHLLGAGSSTFVTAPVVSSRVWNAPVQLNTKVAGHLWQALRTDSVASFARQYPATVTPAAPK